jgi:hypothetical protein
MAVRIPPPFMDNDTAGRETEEKSDEGGVAPNFFSSRPQTDTAQETAAPLLYA